MRRHGHLINNKHLSLFFWWPSPPRTVPTRRNTHHDAELPLNSRRQADIDCRSPLLVPAHGHDLKRTDGQAHLLRLNNAPGRVATAELLGILDCQVECSCSSRARTLQHLTSFQIFSKIFPTFLSASICRCASAMSSNENVVSITGRKSPESNLGSIWEAKP